MKKALLVAAGLALGISSQAQLQKTSAERTIESLPAVKIVEKVAGKDGDTIRGVLNFASSQLNPDSLASYRADASPYDSGYAFGFNAFNDKGFAERFDYNGRDSALQVVGLYAIFDGRYSATSTQTINFRVWSQGARTPVSGRPRSSYNGFPNTVLATQSSSVRNLGISLASNNDTLKQFRFSTPTGYLRDSFFVGYDALYTWTSVTDTFGLKTTRQDYRYKPYYFVQGADTVRNVINAVQESSGTWVDNGWQNFQVGLHYCIFPILVVDYVTGIDGVTHNNLSFFGHSPNPATNSSTVHYSIKSKADVSLVVYDVAGRAVYNYSQNGQPAGAHKVAIDLTNLAAGNYTYLLRTSDGDGMASQLTVTK